MDNSLQFEYTTFDRGQGQPSSFAANNGELGLGNYDSIKHGAPFLASGAHFEQPVMEYTSEGLSYSLGAEPSFVEANFNGTTYWTGSEKLVQRSDILQVHAPVPIPGCTPILRSDSCYSEETGMTDTSTTHYLPPTQYPLEIQPERPPMQRYGSGSGSITSSTSCVARSHSTFLTPSELLVELSARGDQPRQNLSSPCTQELGRAQSTSGKLPRPNLSSRSMLEATAISDSSFLASSFNDSSSETITSHEKKRHYLECLEHYVAFLHEHFRRSGIEPAALERISSYRCLNSRSIRSLLIHMENTTKQMQERIFKEEQKYLRLREALRRKECTLEIAHDIQQVL